MDGDTRNNTLRVRLLSSEHASSRGRLVYDAKYAESFIGSLSRNYSKWLRRITPEALRNRGKGVDSIGLAWLDKMADAIRSGIIFCGDKAA